MPFDCKITDENEKFERGKSHSNSDYFKLLMPSSQLQDAFQGSRSIKTETESCEKISPVAFFERNHQKNINLLFHLLLDLFNFSAAFKLN